MKLFYYKLTNKLLSNPFITIGIGRMIGILSVFLYVLFQGCSSSQKIVEGTSIQFGGYIPFEGNLYGVELVSYVNGLKLQTSTNQSFQVSRTYNATNDWIWGMMKTVESSDTTVQVGCSTTNNVPNSK